MNLHQLLRRLVDLRWHNPFDGGWFAAFAYASVLVDRSRVVPKIARHMAARDVSPNRFVPIRTVLILVLTTVLGAAPGSGDR